MVGGGAQSDIWCQIHADVLNRTVRQMMDPIYANVRRRGPAGGGGIGLPGVR